MFECLVCIYMTYVCGVPMTTEEALSVDWSYRELGAILKVLGLEPQSSREKSVLQQTLPTSPSIQIFNLCITISSM